MNPADLARVKKVGDFYILDKMLGKGAYAECLLGCEVKNEDKLVAIKRIDKSKLNKDAIKELERLKREVNIMKDLSKKENIHIVQMKGVT